MTKILDTHALITYLEKEPGYEIIAKLFREASEHRENLLMTLINYGEAYYTTLTEYGQEQAAELEKYMPTFPIDIVDVDWQLAKEAARIKAAYKMSYTDCFAAALAKLLEGELVTGDAEFKALENEIKISWI